MSDSPPPERPDPRLETLIADFVLLDAHDQEQVLAMVAQLRNPSGPYVEPPPFPPDVPFMDFGE